MEFRTCNFNSAPVVSRNAHYVLHFFVIIMPIPRSNKCDRWHFRGYGSGISADRPWGRWARTEKLASYYDSQAAPSLASPPKRPLFAVHPETFEYPMARCIFSKRIARFVFISTVPSNSYGFSQSVKLLRTSTQIRYSVTRRIYWVNYYSCVLDGSSKGVALLISGVY